MERDGRRKNARKPAPPKRAKPGARGAVHQDVQEYSHLVDNIKAILIFLVVFNHLIAFQIVRTDEIMRHVWYAITIFHMPAFIFVSGYLSKHPQNQLKNFKSLMVPYILGYSLTWFAYYWIGQEIDFEILRPSGSAMWYLLALFFYRLTIEATGKFRLVVIWSIVFALLAGFRPEFSTYLSVSRIVVFFPFFAAGYLWRSSDTQYIRRFTGKLAFLLIGGVLLFSVPHYMILNKLPIDLFRGNHSYQMSGITNETGLILRLLMYIVSFVVIMMLFSLVPQIKLLGFLGRNTMSVFFLHYPILIVLNGLGVLQIPELMTWWGALLLSLGMVIVLASPPVFWIYSKIMQFVGFILFKGEKTGENQTGTELQNARPGSGSEGATGRKASPSYKRRSISLAHRTNYGQGEQAYDVADDESVGYNVYGYHEAPEPTGRRNYTMPYEYGEFPQDGRYSEEASARLPRRPAGGPQTSGSPAEDPRLLRTDPGALIDVSDEFAGIEEDVPSQIVDEVFEND